MVHLVVILGVYVGTLSGHLWRSWAWRGSRFYFYSPISTLDLKIGACSILFDLCMIFNTLLEVLVVGLSGELYTKIIYYQCEEIMEGFIFPKY